MLCKLLEILNNTKYVVFFRLPHHQLQLRCPYLHLKHTWGYVCWNVKYKSETCYISISYFYFLFAHMCFISCFLCFYSLHLKHACNQNMQLFKTYFKLIYTSIWNIHVSMFEKMVSTYFYRSPMDNKDKVCDYNLFFFGDPRKEIFFGQRMMTSNYCSTTKGNSKAPC